MIAAMQQRREQRRLDAVVKEIAALNATHLGNLFQAQADLAHACRRDNLSNCVDALTRQDAHHADAHQRQRTKTDVHFTYTELRQAVGRSTGAHVPRKNNLATPDDLLDLVATAEASEAAAAEHLAYLDRLAAGTTPGAPVRALAAFEAAALRAKADRRELAGLIEKARRALGPEVSDLPSSSTTTPRTADDRIRAIFKMGYVGPLWLGIESALPEGVEIMPDEMARVSTPTWWPRARV